jgi:hypothetical protein
LLEFLLESYQEFLVHLLHLEFVLELELELEQQLLLPHALELLLLVHVLLLHVYQYIVVAQLVARVAAAEVDALLPLRLLQHFLRSANLILLAEQPQPQLLLLRWVLKLAEKNYYRQ